MKFRAARRNMIDSQVRPNGVTDRRVIDAMSMLARENFVPADRQEFAYADEDVPIRREPPPRFLMAAMTFARMLQLAGIRPDDRVLIIGAAMGYGAAVVAQLAAHVVALEEEEDLLRAARANLDGLLNVTVTQGDLSAGANAAGPFDVILIEGLVETVPATIIAQLVEGGRIVAPVGQPTLASLQLGVRRDGGVSWSRGADCAASELPGFKAKVAEFVF